MHWLINLLIQRAICALHANQYLTKIVSTLPYQLSMHFFSWVAYSVGPLCFVLEQIPYQDSKHIFLINYWSTTLISLFGYFDCLFGGLYVPCA